MEIQHTYTHTDPFNGPFPGLPRWAGTRKVKPTWILLKQETVGGSGISWAICKSAPRSRQITMPAPNHYSFLQAGCPSCRLTNSVKALKAQWKYNTQTEYCDSARPSVLWHCWLGSRKGIQPVKTEWWGAGVVVSLEQDADLHIARLMSWCHCHSLSFASLKSRFVLPFWYRLT